MIESLISHPLFRDAIYQNYWLWAHIVVAVIIARILKEKFKLPAPAVIGIILVLAILWEIVEIAGLIYWAGWADSFGDIGGAILGAFIIVFEWKPKKF